MKKYKPKKAYYISRKLETYHVFFSGGKGKFSLEKPPTTNALMAAYFFTSRAEANKCCKALNQYRPLEDLGEWNVDALNDAEALKFEQLTLKF